MTDTTIPPAPTPQTTDDAALDAMWRDRFWTRFYHPSVPARIDDEIAAAGNMAELFTRDAQKFADLTGFVSLGSTRTYGQMLADARAFAAWLQSIGIGKGDRVAIMMPNCLQYPVALFGTLIAGGIVVNVNPLYTARELEHQLNDSGAVAIVVIDMFAATLEQVVARTAVRNVVVTRMGDMMGTLKGAAVNLAMKSQVKPWSIPAAHRFKPLLAKAHRLPLRAVEVSPDDLAFLQYTGGTSGVAKGAMLTHRNVVANTLQGRAWVVNQLAADEVPTNITLLPLYHIFSLTANLLMFIGVGGRNVMIANPRDTKRVEWILRKEHFAGFTGINTLFVGLMENEKFRKRDFSALKVTIAGGMATHSDVARRWQAMTGKPLIEGYGLTECSPVVCIGRVDLADPQSMMHTGTVGLPVPSTEVRMRRDDGTWAGLDEAGELCVRGPQVMRGYWNRPEETAKVLDADGWLATGDVGKMDAKGEVRLVDRIKDMVLVSGFNVYPSEIEDVIADMPEVAEVGVIGVPDTVKGEKVKAIVVPRTPGGVTVEQVLAHARGRLTGYKVPSIVVIRDEPLPKSEVGKILRRELRDKPVAP